MFQTLLFVIGPFVAYAGLGGAALYAAQAWVRKVVMPRHELAKTELDRYDEMADAVEDAQRLLTDLVLEVDSNPALASTLSPRLQARLYELNESTHTLPAQRPSRRKARNRA